VSHRPQLGPYFLCLSQLPWIVQREKAIEKRKSVKEAGATVSDMFYKESFFIVHP
jgi:hypothetical protein